MANLPAELLLSDDELASLTPSELKVYYQALEQAEEEEWTLTERQQYADDLTTQVDDLLFGGSAGSGKSEWALHHANRLSLKYPGHKTLALRRTFPRLRDSLIERSLERFDPALAKYHSGEKVWKYTNGSKITFGYCVEAATPILMGDGTYRRMDEVRVGDVVGTLEGPRRVVRHFHVGRKDSVRFTLQSGASVVASQSHAVLAADGRWLPPSDLSGTTTRSPRAGTLARSSPSIDLWPRMRSRASRRGLRRARSDALAARRAAERLGYAAPVGSDRGTGRRASGTRTPAPPQPPSPTVLLGLHGPAARSAAAAAAPMSAGRARGRDPVVTSLPGSPASCSPGRGPGGGRARPEPATARARTPSRGDAGTFAPPSTRGGGPRSTPSRSPRARSNYSHPYTNQARPLAVDVQPSAARMDPAGEQDLWDMTVEGANHYVSWGGIVHKNCDAEEDVSQYLSTEYDLIVFDELTEFTERMFTKIRSRCRTRLVKRNMGVRPHVIAMTNPGQIGHVWVKRYFVTATDYGQSIVTYDLGDGYTRTAAFVPARVTHNPHIDPDYVRNLRSMDEVSQRQYLHGDWDVFEGQFFSEWNRDVHVIEPFTIPKEWPRATGIDYGYTNPMACVWGAFDQDGKVYIYREMYETKLTPSQQAQRILAASNVNRERIAYNMLDPSCWAKTGIGDSIHDQYRREGLMCKRAMNARRDGWARVREFLKLDEEGKPGIVIFDTCTELIRTFPEAIHDRDNPEDLDTAGDDHLCLVGGSMVATPRGERRLDSIRPGDEVVTRAGTRRVLAAGMTARDQEVLTVTLSNGRSITGTANHPVWTERNGWTRLDALRYGDTLASCDPRSSSSEASSSAATRTPPVGATGSTSPQDPATASAAYAGYTKNFGSLPTDRSLTGTTSTTATATRSTTTSPTWKRSRRASTSVTTSASASATGHGLPRALSRSSAPPSGIGVPKDGRGTAGTASGRGRTERNGWRRASNAAGPTSRSTPDGSVRTTARARGGARRAWTTKFGGASAAATSSSSAGTPPSGPAPVSVVSVTAAGRADVWNLTVDGPPEFFANGVLVHNCDATRYLLMSRPPRSRTKPREPRTTEEKIAARIDRMARRGRGTNHPIMGKSKLYGR